MRKNIKKNNFILSISVVIISISLYIGFGNYAKHKLEKSINDNIQNQEEFVRKVINFLIDEKKNIYLKRFNGMMTPEVLKSLENKDRESFYKIVKQHTDRIKKSDNDFWGMHIIFPNNLSFIRVLKPDVPDDIIPKGKKPLIDKVNETKQLLTSFEAGKFGYFFRINIPIFNDKKEYLGVSEFSINIDTFTKFIKQRTGYENRFLVTNKQNKKFLNKLKQTKDGLYIFGSTYDEKFYTNNNNKVYKYITMKLSQSAYLELYVDITSFVNEKNEFNSYIDLMVLLLSFVTLVVWYFYFKLVKSNKTLQRQSDELNTNIEIISQNVIYSKTDTKGNITEVSDAFCEISGYTRDELIGKPHNIVRHEDMPSEIFKELWSYLKAGKSWEGEIKNKRKDGTYYWTLSQVTIEFDQYEEPIGYMSIRHDITSKKDFEKQHIQLVQSEKMASLGEMIGNIAHQWRQPLSSITSTASSIDLQSQLGMVNDTELQKDMEHIINKTNYLSNIIDTFRDFINDDKEKHYLQIESVLQKAISIVEINLKNNYIDIQKDFDISKAHSIEMVEGEFSQVIINIINNSKDALVKNDIQKPLVKVRLYDDKNNIIITIEDNAGGIPKDIIGKIFEPYFTTKHQSQGAGLGLHMSYKIVTESLLGKLLVQNTTQGAVFSIIIPK
ncbi:MAG: PAS domain S-box protein [Campylobacterota bacterium]|nr:PAS domain S-box protein [Campylobacterota bacterium]